MTDLLSELPDFPSSTYAHLLHSLEKARITTVDLITLDCTEIAKRARLPALDVQRLREDILAALQANLGIIGHSPCVLEGNGGRNASGVCPKQAPLVRNDQVWDTISVDDAGLNDFLGGLPTGYITEIVGESGSGKTQLLLSLLIRVQLPRPYGLQRCALHISTEHTLPCTRLSQILASIEDTKSWPKAQTATFLPSLSNVMSIHAPDLDTQDHILAFHVPVVLQRHDIGLIVIDSIAANLRDATDAASRAAGLGIRSARLIRLGALLRKYAREYNCAIIVANQVGDRFESREPSSPFMSSVATPSSTPLSPVASQTHLSATQRPIPSPSFHQIRPKQHMNPYTLDHQQRFFTGWGDVPSQPRSFNSSAPLLTSPSVLKTPSLGLTWANQIACRIALIKDSCEQSDSRSMWQRHIRLVFAPWAQPDAESRTRIEFEIWSGGIREVERAPLSKDRASGCRKET